MTEPSMPPVPRRPFWRRCLSHWPLQLLGAVVVMGAVILIPNFRHG